MTSKNRKHRLARMSKGDLDGEVEQLEARVLLTITPEEQLFVYLLNRARHDPASYSQEQSLGVNLSYVSSQPPLAVNNLLYASSGFHSNEMATFNYFGHQSQVTGDWPNKMVRDQGYSLPEWWTSNANYVESAAAGTDTAVYTLNTLIVDAGVPSLGHRNHLLSIGSFQQEDREIGIGHSFNINSNYDHYWAIHITRSDPLDTFLTGVAFNDLNNNGRYDLNEGLSGVSISTQGLQTTTNAAGGWSIKVAGSGTYTVTASGGSFNGSSTANVNVSSRNREVDFISGNPQAVVDFRYPPTGISLSNSTVVENSPAQTHVGNLSSVGSGSANTYAYSLVSGDGSTDNSSFAIVNGTLKTSAAFDYESKSSYSIRIRTTDQEGMWFEKVFSIGVINANESPTDVILSGSSIPENSVVGSVVGVLDSVDPDSSNTFSYGLVSGAGSADNAYFEVVGNTLKTNSVFDYESRTSYSIRVRSTDQGGLWCDKIFTVNVSDLNDTPTDIALSNSSIRENSVVDTTVGDFSSIGLWDFHEDFSSAFTHDWAGTSGELPFESLAPLQTYGIPHVGPPGFTFSTIGGTSVISLHSASVPANSRLGFVSRAILDGSTGQIEARVNTQDQGDPNIDGLFELWLVNADDKSKYVRLGFFGDMFDTQRKWTSSTNTEGFQAPPFSYLSNTWYRLRISQLPEASLEVSIWNDAGSEKLVSRTFSHNLLSLGSRFRVGFSQFMGSTDGSKSLKSAVDFIGAVNTFTYSLVPGIGSTDNSSFSLVGNTLKTAAVFDFEGKASYSIRVRTTDQNGSWFEKVFTLNITNANDAPVLNSTGTPMLEAIEANIPNSSNQGTLVSTIISRMAPNGGITDADTGSLSGIAINGLTGTANGTWEFTVDDGVTWFPVATTGNTNARLLASDANTRIRYVPNTGFSGQASLAFVAWDRTNGTNGGVANVSSRGGTTPFSVIYDYASIVVYGPPTNIALSNSSVPENSAISTSVGTLGSTDPDFGNTFTYSLVAGDGSTDNASFSIVGNVLKTAAVFNFEAKSSFSIRLRTTDQSGLWFEKVFVITATNVNEAPTDVALSKNTVPENSSVGTSVASISTIDPDAGNTFTYSLVTGNGSTDNASFSIVSNILKTATIFNFEAKSSYSIRVRATDQGGSTFEKVFTLTITNTNDAPELNASGSPTLDGIVQNISDSANSGTLISTIISRMSPNGGITDVDSGALSGIAINGLTGTSNGLWQFSINNGVAWTAVATTGNTNARLLASDANTRIRYVPNTGFSGQASFAFVAWDRTNGTNGGVANVSSRGGTTPFSVTYDYASIIVNAPPTNIVLSNSSVPENSGVGTSVGNLSTAGTGNTFTYNLVDGTGSTNNSSFSIVGNTLKTAAVFDYESKGSYSVRVRTTNQTGQWFERVFLVLITNSNEAPTDVGLSKNTVPENSSVGTSVALISTIDPDAGNTFTYSLVAGNGSTDNASFSIISNTLKTAAIFNFEAKSSYSIRVRATDQGGLWSEKVFFITVTNVNETPTNIALSSSALPENRAVGTSAGIFSSVDSDTGNTFTYSLVSGTGSTDNAAFDIVGNTLRTASVFDFETKSNYSIRVRSTDQGGLWFEKIFTVAVTDVAESFARTSVATFREGVWYLDSNANRTWNGIGGGDSSFSFGSTGDKPITGDWNGDGKTDVGFFRNGSFYLDLNGNRKWDGGFPNDSLFGFGAVSDTPVAGDWNGDGKTDVGVFRNGTFYLDANGNRKWDGTSAGDVQFGLGGVIGTPVTGDWNGDGKTDVGVYAGGSFYLDANGNRHWDGPFPNDSVFGFGAISDKPITGDWNGDGKTDVGVYRNGTFYLDANANRKWDGGFPNDTFFGFGGASDIPVSGIWSGSLPTASLQALTPNFLGDPKVSSLSRTPESVRSVVLGNIQPKKSVSVIKKHKGISDPEALRFLDEFFTLELAGIA